MTTVSESLPEAGDKRETQQMMKDYLKYSDECKAGVAFTFLPKKRNQRITFDAVERELFEIGMGGCFYGAVIRVPDEFPDEYRDSIDIYDTEEMAVIMAQLAGYTVYDRNGKLLCGRPV